MNPNAEPREDGPALQRLFATIEGPGQHVDAGTAMAELQAGKPKAGELTCHHCGAKELEPHLDDCPLVDTGDDGDAIPEGFEDIGPIHYAHKLHEAGEAAIAILSNMCEAEFAQGNPRNLPEPILAWYAMTLSYQLCVLEATLQRYDQRKAHAGQLQAARNAFAKYTGPYADSVRADIAETLDKRYRPKGLEEESKTYHGVLL